MGCVRTRALIESSRHPCAPPLLSGDVTAPDGSDWLDYSPPCIGH